MSSKVMGNEDLLKKYIEDFKTRTGYDDTKKEDDIYKYAVDKAYNDAKRAIEGIGKYSSEKDIAKNDLVEVIKKYFQGNNKFDHEEYCKAFFTPLKKAGYKKATYGVAQKIVNLTFKYLYCNDEFRKKYKDKFNECHMVLDSYILSWFNNKKIANGSRYNGTWSGLNDYEKYKEMQKAIKEYVETQTKDDSLTVLEYEFILWPNTLLYKAASSWAKVICLDSERNITDIKEFIEKIGEKTKEYAKGIDDNLKELL